MYKVIKFLKYFFPLALILFVFGYGILCNFGFSGIYNNEKHIEGQTKVACVGDSITYGHGIWDWETNHYPKQLGNILGDGYCVHNYGVSGSCAQDDSDKPYQEQKAYNESIAFDADILVFMLGSNDTKPENWKGIDEFKKDYLALLDTYLEDNKDLKIYLCTLSKAFYANEGDELANFDIDPKIVDEISNCIKEIAAERGYELIDINFATSNHQEWYKDGIHPNKDGAKFIAETIAEKIKK